MLVKTVPVLDIPQSMTDFVMLGCLHHKMNIMIFLLGMFPYNTVFREKANTTAYSQALAMKHVTGHNNHRSSAIRLASALIKSKTQLHRHAVITINIKVKQGSENNH